MNKKNELIEKGSGTNITITVGFVVRTPVSSIEALEKAIDSVPQTVTMYRRVSGNYLRIVEA